MELMDLDKEEMQSKVAKLVRKSEAKKRLIVTIIIFVMFLLTAVCAVIYGHNLAKEQANEKNVELTAELDDAQTQIDELKQEIEDLIENPIVVNPVAPKIELEIINKEIRDIGELATVEYLFTDAARYSDSKQIKNWNVPLTEKSFTLKWDGVIKAGIQVNAISVEVDEEEKKLIVSMPAAEILSYSVDNDSIEVLDEKSNMFNPITVEDKVKLDGKTEAAMKERAIENGLLEKAKKNAENIISNLLRANPAVADIYSIEFITIQ